MEFKALVYGFRLSLVPLCVFVSACGNGDKAVAVDEQPDDPGSVVVVQEPVQEPTPVGEIIPAEDQRVIATEEIKPYVQNARYSAVLAECALIPYQTPCTLGELPYLGQQHASPTVENVMERVVVTHDWMGVRFERMLRILPADMLQLFRPVTVIVIGSEVRPSSFSPSRGRVRLDPRHLWLSVDEKRTIATNDDPRNAFGSALQFDWLSRFTVGDEYAWYYWSLTSDSERTVDDIELSLASLLYHELAHANDYIQPRRFSELTSDMTPWDAAVATADTRVSEQLHDRRDLTADPSFLYGLAGVFFFDDEATEFQRTVQADFAGAQMAAEGKPSFYSYSTNREDVAELFEAFMMKYHYNAESHVGFAPNPTVEDPSCDDYVVAWGERNRLAAALVAPRAKFVVDSILDPSVEIDRFHASELGEAAALRQGEGWCESRFVVPRSEKRVGDGFPRHMLLKHSVDIH